MSTQEITLFDNESETSMYKYKMTLEKINEELINFGLTKNQAKVFIYLGKYGSKTAPEVSKALQIPRTETYHILNSLQNLGLILSKLTHPTKYTALEMQKAIMTLVKQERERINTLAEKERELSQLWKEVPFFVVETDESKSEKMQLLHGSGPVINKIKNMIEGSNESIKIYGTLTDVLRLYNADVFDYFDGLNSEYQTIVSHVDKIPEFICDLAPNSSKIIKSTSDNKCFVVNDAGEVLIFMRNATHPTRQIIAWWSDSDALYDMMNSLFDLTWEKAEVPKK